MANMTGEGRRKDRLRRRSSGGASSAARPQEERQRGRRMERAEGADLFT
jgi:hypothetical protein